MSEFIRLTDIDTEVFAIIRKSSITCICEKYNDPQNGAVVFIGDNQEGTHVCEHVDYIMDHLEPSPVILDQAYPEFNRPYEDTTEYWMARSQYWKLRSYHFERLTANPPPPLVNASPVDPQGS